MLRHTHPRRQGDLGELAAMDWLTRSGATVFVPLFHSPDCDLVADYGARLLRVQVKTSTFFRSGRFEVCLSTAGGNQSWSGVVKRFDPSRYDLLFVLVEGGRRWCIPATAIGGTRAILLGGPKYASFELGDKDAPMVAQRLLEWPSEPLGGAPEWESRVRL